MGSGHSSFILGRNCPIERLCRPAINYTDYYRPTGSSTQQTQVPVNLTVKPTKQVTIPVTGVFVKVSYIGGFSGTYGVNNVTEKVRNSGEKLYEITNATGNVSATFKKEDGSTKHDIIVESLKTGNR